MQNKKFIETFVNCKSNPLDFKTSHVLGVIGSGPVSKVIQKYQTCDIPRAERWSHVACYVQDPETHKFCIIESHLDSRGCVKPSPSDWWKQNKNKKVYAFEYYQLDPRQLIVYPREKIKYGTKGVLRAWLNKEIGLSQEDDPNGVFCSELLAKCDLLQASKILNKPTHTIYPADFQLLAGHLKLNIKEVKG